MRPAVSVVVPFAEGRAEARWLAAGLGRLEMGGGDELIVVDNRPDPADRPEQLEPLAKLALIVEAPALHSSYYARNLGARAAQGEWLLFIDSDCHPRPDLLAKIAPQTPDPRLGIVAGEVEALAGQRGSAAEHARERGHLGVAAHLRKGPRPSGVGANLLVRRTCWESLGGFHEVRSGADIEFCWRAQELDWQLTYAPEAIVSHRHPETLGAMARKARRYGPGQLWLRRRYPGSTPRPDTATQLTRAAGGALIWATLRQHRRARLKLIDGLWEGAYGWGWLAGSNRAELGPRTGRASAAAPTSRIAYLLDAYPAASETFVYREVERIEARLGPPLIESMSRPERPAPEATRGAGITYMEDDSPRKKLGDLAWLARHNPRGVLADQRLLRGLEGRDLAWPTAAIAPAIRRLHAAGIRHIHVHFAAGAALNAMRIARLLGISYSLHPHAYEIFRQPTDLELKLRGAAVVLAPSRYTAAELERRLEGLRTKVVPMGIDANEFTRSTPLPDKRVVVAVGRLVAKKGFDQLIRAAAILASEGRLGGVEIIGEGPEREALVALISELGLEESVSIESAWGATAVRARLERARVFAMPSVVAPDGDREASPVVIREAMAMEVPVVASDSAGIGELVDPEWGRLVSPGDPRALASALGQVLELPTAELERMGSAARAWIREHGSIESTAGLTADHLAPLVRRGAATRSSTADGA